MPLSAQDYAALSRRPDLASALNYASQGSNALQQGYRMREQKRAAGEQEQLELNRQEERNRAAEENEEQARNREAARVAEKLRDVRLKTMVKMHGMFEAGFSKEARELGRIAGMEAGEVTAERLEREMKEDAVNRMEEARKLDEAEEKQFQEDAEVQAEYDAATPQTAATPQMIDPSRAMSPEQAMSLNNFLTQQAGQAMQDIQAVQPAAPPQQMQQPQMQGPPPQQMMAPPGGLPPQMMQPQPQMQAPVQQPAQPAPRPAPPMPGAMPGMLPIQMDPREVQRVITEKKIVEGTARGQDYFMQQKASAPPQEQAVLDAMIESVPELMAAYGGDYDKAMSKIAQGYHSKPIVDRILAREKIEASERNARRMATGRGTKQDVGNYDKGRKMVETRMGKYKLTESVKGHGMLEKAIKKIASSNPKDQAEGLKMMAKAREGGKITDRDMIDLMGSKSVFQSLIDKFQVAGFGGLSEKDQRDFILGLGTSIEDSTAELQKLHRRAMVEVKNAKSRDKGGSTDFGDGAEQVAKAMFQDVDLGNYLETADAEERALIEAEENASQNRGTEGRRRRKKDTGKARKYFGGGGE